MASKGPIRNVDSVRSLKEGGFISDKPEQVTPPKWLDKRGRNEFRILIQDLTAAQVPIKQADSQIIACCAKCLASISEWSKKESDPTLSFKEQLQANQQVARHQRDAITYMNELGMSPMSRVRLGLRQSAKPEGTLAKLLQAKQASNNNAA